MIGPEVMLLARSRRFDRTDIPMSVQGKGGIREIVIGNDVWIGVRALILPDVKIGEGAVVVAVAVVTKEAPLYAVVGGNPAKVIKIRKTEVEQRGEERKKILDEISIKLR